MFVLLLIAVLIVAGTTGDHEFVQFPDHKVVDLAARNHVVGLTRRADMFVLASRVIALLAL